MPSSCNAQVLRVRVSYLFQYGHKTQGLSWKKATKREVVSLHHRHASKQNVACRPQKWKSLYKMESSRFYTGHQTWPRMKKWTPAVHLYPPPVSHTATPAPPPLPESLEKWWWLRWRGDKVKQGRWTMELVRVTWQVPPPLFSFHHLRLRTCSLPISWSLSTAALTMVRYGEPESGGGLT